MSMQDHISDLLTRIRNGSRATQKEVLVHKTKLNAAILSVLKQEGFIQDVVENTETRFLHVFLKFNGTAPVIHKLDRVSRPSRRVYMSSKEAFSPKWRRGLGLWILSTSKGVMPHYAAADPSVSVGGEVLCYVE
jgi:small subunit ribosomal protein S8